MLEHSLAIAVVGFSAGIINAIAGASSLITFPLFIWLGLPPLVANVTNCVGITPSNFSAAWGFRRELQSQRGMLLKLVPVAVLGSVIGGMLLLSLPSRSFERIVPALVALASILTLLQPLIARRLQTAAPGRGRRGLFYGGVFAIAVYGGYFGTGIGMLFLAVLSFSVNETLHRLTAAKNVLQGISNGCAGLLFCFIAPVDWHAAAVLAVSAGLGGPVGARLTRVIPATPLRLLIGTIGLTAAVALAIR